MRRLFGPLCILAIAIMVVSPGPKAGAGELAASYSVAKGEVFEGGSAGLLLVSVTNLDLETIGNLDLRTSGGSVYLPPHGVAQLGDIPAGGTVSAILPFAGDERFLEQLLPLPLRAAFSVDGQRLDTGLVAHAQ